MLDLLGENLQKENKVRRESGREEREETEETFQQVLNKDDRVQFRSMVTVVTHLKLLDR